MTLPIDKQVETILFTVLNWGLGHASRSIPIINQLLLQGKKVILASDGEALELLKREFPQLPTEMLPPYKVSYNKPYLWHIVASNFFNVLTAILKEKQQVNRLINKHRADMIISDSRYGFYSKKLPAVIVTHQLRLQANNPIFKFCLNQINKLLLTRFDACWIPDEPGSKWSGDLSSRTSLKKYYLGISSRLEPGNKPIKYRLGFFLSGPEPARSNLEREIINAFGESDLDICLVRGTNLKPDLALPKKWTTFNLITTKKMNQLLLESENIVSRSGYSSIMDYVKLKRGAYLIPTPGQSEQEYLAERLDGQEGFKHSSIEKLKTIFC